MSFLKAEWRKLAFANYEIDPKILTSHLPYGTELDLWNGKCFVSLVGFKFVNVKVLGIRVPFHTNFEEVNLRFYVKRIENGIVKRGVVFIKEIVPKRAITYVANTLYRENYETTPMRYKWTDYPDKCTVEYHWKKNNAWSHLKVEADLQRSEIAENSETEFITEHYWGYARVNPHLTNEYEVTHPRWHQYNVRDYNIECDFGDLYGKEFSLLNDIEPSSVFLAEGSKITVEGKKKIKKPS